MAIKYLCPGLVHHIVNHLSKRLRPTSVLQVLAWGDHYASGYNDFHTPSAPPLWDVMEEATIVIDGTSHGQHEHIAKSEQTASSKRRHSESCLISPPPSHAQQIPKVCSSRTLHKVFPDSICTTTDPCTIDPTSCCRVLVTHCLSHIDCHSPEVSSCCYLNLLFKYLLQQFYYFLYFLLQSLMCGLNFR